MTSPPAGLLDVPDDVFEFNEWAWVHRWGDGLPLLPPTPERVEQMLEGTTWPRGSVVGKIPTRFAAATVEAIAVNAVMAGCQPSAMPVLIAAVEAMCDPAVNLYVGQSTTHPCAVMVMVSGPLGEVAEIHSGAGLFGPGFRANATIGRAVRLVQQNVGGAWPGETDLSTHGSAAKFSFCFAENEAESPWGPYRVDRGYAADETIVSVVAAEPPHNLNEHMSDGAANILFTFAHTIATIGPNNPYCRPSDFVVVVCPEHARIIDGDGFSRADVSEYLHERARIPYKEWKRGGMFGLYPQPRYLDAADDDLMVRITDTPDDIHVVVAGGPGRHSAWIPTLAVSRVTTRVVADPDGRPVLPGRS